MRALNSQAAGQPRGAAPTPDGSSAIIHKPARAASARRGERRPFAVLYVEDNPSNLRLIQHFLARFPDLQLLTAMQGRAGIELARAHRPGVILLDLHLPDMPGEEVLDRLRADETTGQIPVIILSADAAEPQRQRLLAKGAAHFMVKPFDLRDLERILRDARGDDR